MTKRNHFIYINLKKKEYQVLSYEIITDPDGFKGSLSKDGYIDFLFEHLEEYGDKREDIARAVGYAFSKERGKGGFVLAAWENSSLVGGVVINDSGMSGYIPDHILVYIVVHKEFRGRGFGAEILKKAIEECKGNIALHVEYDNKPAINLYKKVGFKSKYAEMRYEKE